MSALGDTVCLAEGRAGLCHFVTLEALLRACRGFEATAEHFERVAE